MPSCISLRSLSFFQPFTNNADDKDQNAQQENKTLKDRFCADWRVIPALTTLITCILGVVLSVLWNYPYLGIPFGAGSVGATYMLYLAYQYRHLQSLEGSSKKFEEENERLHEEVDRLHADFSAENDRLRVQIDRLHSDVDSLSKQRQALERTVAETTQNLEEAQSMLKQCQEAMELQRKLTDALSGLQRAMEEDHTQFTSSVENFSGDLSNFTQQAQQNNETAISIAQDLKQTGQALGFIFSQVNKLLSKDTYKDQISLQKELNTQLRELREELAAKKTQHAILETSINSLKEESDRLARVRSGLYKGVDDLGNQVNQLTQVKEGLQKIIDSKKRNPDDNDPPGAAAN